MEVKVLEKKLHRLKDFILLIRVEDVDKSWIKSLCLRNFTIYEYAIELTNYILFV